METKYTPGPWHVDANKNVMAAGGLVAFPGIAAGFDQYANARLIAAAPELYIEAFELIGDLDPENMDRRFDGLRAALAKAEGR